MLLKQYYQEHVPKVHLRTIFIIVIYLELRLKEDVKIKV